MPTAIDLFAGAGGATQGLRDAGFDVLAAVEIERDAAETWRLNHPGVMFEDDIRNLDPGEMLVQLGLERGELSLLKACPPCQGFSSLRGTRSPDDARNDLVLDTLRFVEAFRPQAVLLENVPGLQRDRRFADLTGGIQDLGYSLQHYIVEASTLGVPQRRRRLVVVALQGADHDLPVDPIALMPPDTRRQPMSAGAALLAVVREIPDGDQWHRWRRSSDLVARRIAAIPEGGNRFDLPDDLALDCHKRLTKGGSTARVATGSYGRIRANEPAPTMTTRCTTPACGPFIHPTEHRGLSIREAAAFQTFPSGYRWNGGHDSVERQIGNAVPVWMAEALGSAVLRLISSKAISN